MPCACSDAIDDRFKCDSQCAEEASPVIQIRAAAPAPTYILVGRHGLNGSVNNDHLDVYQYDHCIHVDGP
ncbi:hypothetical protein Dda_6086 [Drechslerella dactyloides]|uniref:Uncharacterized protein n=1 Tax=Drechslerella dactyloides TaxID=74499 RepID=A0AAD6IUW5_DREDA|nr:hypothetical protein Dda_6086 [Drechslerella dactyloides]